MRIVLDVGTSLSWIRPPVGIVRAERQFAAFLLAQTAADVAFCRFDRGRACYDEVSAAAVRGLLERGQGDPAAVQLPRDEQPPAETSDGATRRGRRLVSSLARRSIGMLPEGMRQDAGLVAQSGTLMLKSLYWLSRKAMHEVKRTGPRPEVQRLPAAEPAPPRAPGFAFRPDDVYVSMGLDWDYNDLSTLYARKRDVGFKAVLYCHDLIPIRYPHLMSFDARAVFARHFVDVAHTADHVVAVSRASLDDFREFLHEVGAPVPPISVIHNGSDLAADDEEAGEPPRPELADRPFVLCVGTIEARKNHALLYNVWDRLVARHGERTPLLVLVGMVGWGVGDLLWRMRGNPRVAEHIVLLSELSDEGLQWLYHHCLFTVYPSFVEGWGLPVVESLAVGKPCVASNAAAIVEASQGRVPLLDPLDFPAWLAQIERWAFDRRALAAATASLEGFVPDSWQQHGEAMLAVARDLSGTPACASSI